MTSRPPRLARWLLLLIPAPDREFIEGDLEEEHAARLALDRRRADAWYWGQVLATLPPVFAERLRKAATHTDPQRRIPAMTSPKAPAFGSLLLASRPPVENRLAANFVSLLLHAGIVGGFVYGTMNQEPEASWSEPEIVEIHQDMEQPPPPPPPPVVAAVPSYSPPIVLAPPDIIPEGIPAAGLREITAEEINDWTRPVGADTTGARSEAVVAIGETPSFTPFTVRPVMRNSDEVGAALQREYPSMLRDAGIGGRVEVWIRLDERGVVQDTQVNVSSGHPSLDDAALRVARIMEFTAAMNRDKAVPVWVSVPITFQVR